MMKNFKSETIALGIVGLVGIAWGGIILATGGGWAGTLGVAGFFIVVTGGVWALILWSSGGFTGLKADEAKQTETDKMRRRLYEAHVAEMAHLNARIEQINERQRERQEQREQERANLIALREELLTSK